MASRADQDLSECLLKSFKVVTAAAVRGRLCKLGANDNEITICAAGEQGIGIFISDAPVGAWTTVAMLSGGGVVPVVVGTGGATRNSYAVAVANGLTNQVLGGGTVVRHIAGVFTQTGVAGDMVGLQIEAFGGVSA
ncbi:MAG: hypothetical protein HOO96_35985 [Polyangiaceae bacterium]|nr:hypothetical protein [Polyangiaceae bacterium]